MEITNSIVLQKSILRISKDGYIRLNEKILRSIDYHLFSSGLYEEPLNSECINDRQSELVGYAEWVSKTIPKISIGWDWLFDCKRHQPSYVMVGLPYSNIILQDKNGKNLEAEMGLKILASFIKNWDWMRDLNYSIIQKYS